MAKVKTKAKYWRDFLGGWDFDAEDDTGIFQDVEIDEELVKRFEKILKEYSDVCEEIEKVVKG